MTFTRSLTSYIPSDSQKKNDQIKKYKNVQSVDEDHQIALHKAAVLGNLFSLYSGQP